MSRNNNDSDSAIGCISLIILGSILPQLIILLEVATTFLMIGVPAYVIYRLYQYNTETGKLTMMFERTFKLDQAKRTIELPPSNETLLLSENATPNEQIQAQLTEIKNELDNLKGENEYLKENRNQDIQTAIEIYKEKQNLDSTKKVLKNFFEDDTGDYVRSDEFEQQSHQKEVEKQKNELEIRGMKQEMRERLFESEKQTFENKVELKEELGSFKEEVRTEFTRVSDKLMQLEGSVITLRAYVDTRFSQMEVMFHKAIAEVKEMIGNLRVELKTEISDMKVAFSKEIVRLDRQQLKIISQMEKYEATIAKFTQDMRSIKIEAQKMAMRGEHMLNRANVVYQKHQAQMYRMSKDIEVGLKEISVSKKDFANTVGRAKLMMDKVANDQYLTLKDIAHEKVGVEMLRSDHSSRVKLENQRLQGLVKDKTNLEQKIRLNLNNYSKVQQLQHRLFMTKENLQHSQNRYNILNQEQSVFHKLSRRK